MIEVPQNTITEAAAAEAIDNISGADVNSGAFNLLPDKLRGKLAILSAVAIGSIGIGAAETPVAQASIDGPAYFVDYNQNQVEHVR